jgi:hypothetical protein
MVEDCGSIRPWPNRHSSPVEKGCLKVQMFFNFCLSTPPPTSPRLIRATNDEQREQIPREEISLHRIRRMFSDRRKSTESRTNMAPSCHISTTSSNTTEGGNLDLKIEIKFPSSKKLTHIFPSTLL